MSKVGFSYSFLVLVMTYLSVSKHLLDTNYTCNTWTITFWIYYESHFWRHMICGTYLVFENCSVKDKQYASD